MSPRTGRPTDQPKRNRLEIRLSDVEDDLLEKDSQETKATKTELLMEGYALSHLITGKELKERLIREYSNLENLNFKLQGEILKMRCVNYLPMFSEKEKAEKIEDYEKRIEVNNWLRKSVKNQLKREFNYEI